MGDRVQLGWRVPEHVYEEFKQCAPDEFGREAVSTGEALDLALREYVDDDRYIAVEERLDDLLGELDHDIQRDIEKKTQSRGGATTGKSVLVNARVQKQTKQTVRAFANEYETPYGVVACSAMRHFLHGGRPGRMLDKLQHATKVVAQGGFEQSARERRLTSICGVLEGPPFDLDDFSEAVHRTDGIHPGGYARRRYLGRVLDRLNAAPLPAKPTTFVERDASSISDPPDPRNLLWCIMESEDLRAALATEAVERGAEQGKTVVEATAIAAIIPGETTPNTSTIETAMRTLSARPGLNFERRESTAKLKVNFRKVAQNPGEHDQALTVAGVTDPDPTPTAEQDTATPATADGGDVEEEVDRLQQAEPVRGED